MTCSAIGLGKTVEALAIDSQKRKDYGTEFATKRGKVMTLVISPLTVIGSWVDHFKQWQPHLKVVVIDPRDRNLFISAAKRARGDVFICHWDALRLMPELKKIYWFHIIADEVHRAKNRDAQQTRALKNLPAMHKLGLSGTPADNRPDDFWSVLNWVRPDLFSSYWGFCRKHVLFRVHNKGFCLACELEGKDAFHKNQYREVLGCDLLEELHASIESFYIRRLKEDVLKELPDKYYSTIYVSLGPQQRRAYEEMRKNMLAWVGTHENEPIAAPVVVAKLVRLQQFACAYGRIEEVKVRVKCDDYVNCNRAHERFRGEPYHNELREKLFLNDPSTKLDAVMDLISDNPKKQIGFFAQSRQLIEMLEERLRQKDISAAILTGKTKQEDRAKIVEDFQCGKRQIFAGTYAAGGIGITLTAASTVGRIDRPWSPSADQQAVDRFHRIGQKNAVHVIDFVARDTIDAERNDKIDWKWDILRRLLGDDK